MLIARLVVVTDLQLRAEDLVPLGLVLADVVEGVADRDQVIVAAGQLAVQVEACLVELDPALRLRTPLVILKYGKEYPTDKHFANRLD